MRTRRVSLRPARRRWAGRPDRDARRSRAWPRAERDRRKEGWDMGCLFVLFAGMFPRFADVILWIARPNQFLRPFDGNWFWPLLGIVFLPLTTLFYVFMWTPGVGLNGFDWLWLGLAVLLDISHWVSSGYANRERIPG